MTDAALTNANTYAQVRIREPAGERTFGETLTVGGVGAEVVVPGAGPGTVLRIERRKAVWAACPAGETVVRFDGRALVEARELRRHDVIAVGDAQVVVTDVSRTLLRLDVSHLVGNTTVPPAAAIAALPVEVGGDEELEIKAVDVSAGSVGAAMSRMPSGHGKKRQRLGWLTRLSIKVGTVVLLAVAALASLLHPVAVEVEPAAARVRVPGTFIAIHTAKRLLLLSGTHVVRAESEGYLPAQATVVVGGATGASVRLSLTKLPGTLRIDTSGIASTITVDGIERGHAPGVIQVAPGQHTVTLRAPRYVDYIATIDVEGAGKRQDLKAALQPSWGTLQISAMPRGARISVDGTDYGAAPAIVDAPSGVRVVRISSPTLKTWESSVVLKAGESLSIGPITLGQPDAHLSIRSEPSGAEVTIARRLRGRTPLETDLPPGMQHEVMVNLPGYAPWVRTVDANSGKTLTVDARLELVGARVTVQGDPDDAELLIDGTPSGRTPLSLELSAVEHRIDVRKEGWIAFSGAVTPAKGFDRTVQYRLVSQDSLSLASTVYSQTGYMLRLVPPGAFTMGADRREQGRRPNEGFRVVTLKRPFYLGATEMTNEQFRRFRSGHSSGFVDRRSLDLDEQPVSQVSWNDAAEFCNWLSEQDNLPPAYEKREERYVLKRPVALGYRLPTEAEWEYAARYAASGQFNRFAWGDALPVPTDVGNLAGAETGNSLPASLSGYRDGYAVAAPVGRFKATALGLHDMSGNVSEWVNDYYLSFVDSGPVTDPLGPDDGGRHVVRGANWKSSAVADLRLAWRDGADSGGTTIGFRVARYAE